MLFVKVAKRTDFCVYRRSYLICPPVVVPPPSAPRSPFFSVFCIRNRLRPHPRPPVVVRPEGENDPKPCRQKRGHPRSFAQTGEGKCRASEAHSRPGINARKIFTEKRPKCYPRTGGADLYSIRTVGDICACFFVGLVSLETIV